MKKLLFVKHKDPNEVVKMLTALVAQAGVASPNNKDTGGKPTLIKKILSWFRG